MLLLTNKNVVTRYICMRCIPRHTLNTTLIVNTVISFNQTIVGNLDEVVDYLLIASTNYFQTNVEMVEEVYITANHSNGVNGCITTLIQIVPDYSSIQTVLTNPEVLSGEVGLINCLCTNPQFIELVNGHSCTVECKSSIADLVEGIAYKTKLGQLCLTDNQTLIFASAIGCSLHQVVDTVNILTIFFMMYHNIKNFLRTGERGKLTLSNKVTKFVNNNQECVVCRTSVSISVSTKYKTVIGQFGERCYIVSTRNTRDTSIFTLPSKSCKKTRIILVVLSNNDIRVVCRVDTIGFCVTSNNDAVRITLIYIDFCQFAIRITSNVGIVGAERLLPH